MSPPPTVIHFTCHACGMALTVPLEIAGVSGPCPQCQTMIASPRPVQEPAPVPAPMPQYPAAGYGAEQGVPAPLPVMPVPVQATAPGSVPTAADYWSAPQLTVPALPAPAPPQQQYPAPQQTPLIPVPAFPTAPSSAMPPWGASALLPLGTVPEEHESPVAPSSHSYGQPTPPQQASQPVAPLQGFPQTYPQAVSRQLDPTPSVVPRDFAAWQQANAAPSATQPTLPSAPAASPAPAAASAPWPSHLPTLEQLRGNAPSPAPQQAQAFANPVPAQAQPAAGELRVSGSHPVLSQVLQSPPQVGAQAPAPPAVAVPPQEASTKPGQVNPWSAMPKQTTLPNSGAGRTVAEKHAHAQTPLAGSQAFRNQRHTSVDTTGRRAAMIGSLFMAALVLAGIGWFFRDQIRIAYYTHLAQRQPAEEESGAPAQPPTDTPATAPASGAFSPEATSASTPPPSAASPTAPSPPSAAVATPPEVIAPALNAGSPAPVEGIPATAPPRAEIPTLDPPPLFSETSGKNGAEASSGTGGNPMTNPGPPVTIRPASPADAKRTGELPQVPETPSPPPPPAYPTRTANPGRIVESATPETQGAVEALKNFLAAPDWKTRAKYVQTPDKLKSTMERYYQQNPSPAISVGQIQLLRHDKNPNTGGGPHCVFQIAGGELKQPIPVMVEQEENDWKVDWLTFTEFKDELLQKFLSEYQDEPRRFHVMMRRTHYFDNDVPSPDMACYEVQPPMPGFSEYVFVPVHSRLIGELDRSFGWGVAKSAAIVELQWRKLDNHQWVELTAVPQYNWRNPAAAKVPVKAELVE